MNTDELYSLISKQVLVGHVPVGVDKRPLYNITMTLNFTFDFSFQLLISPPQHKHCPEPLSLGPRLPDGLPEIKVVGGAMDEDEVAAVAAQEGGEADEGDGGKVEQGGM